MSNISLDLSILAERLAICQLDHQAEIPDWAIQRPFFAITRTGDELSIVCPEQLIPPEACCEGGWRALKLKGPFAFDLTGILAAVATPLAEAEIGIFAISTYDTDYVLVKAAQLDRAVQVLQEGGHRVLR